MWSYVTRTDSGNKSFVVWVKLDRQIDRAIYRFFLWQKDLKTLGYFTKLREEEDVGIQWEWLIIENVCISCFLAFSRHTHVHTHAKCQIPHEDH